MDPVLIMPVLVCLACLVFVLFRVRALWQCWTSLIVCDDNKVLKGGFNCQAPWERLGQKPRGESQIFSRCHVRIVPLA
jgi:hypothetical protein